MRLALSSKHPRLAHIAKLRLSSAKQPLSAAGRLAMPIRFEDSFSIPICSSKSGTYAEGQPLEPLPVVRRSRLGPPWLPQPAMPTVTC